MHPLGSLYDDEEHPLKCPYVKCTYTGRFSRQYELDRHIVSKHEAKKPFTCPFRGCYAGTQVRSFSRSDKLTSHIRNIHGRHPKKVLDCCFAGCAQTALPLDLLGVHIRLSHNLASGDWITKQKARALMNAGSPAYHRCPLWRCCKSLPLSSFMQHLASHSKDDLEESHEDLSSDGFVVSDVPHSVSHHGNSSHASEPMISRSAMQILVSCPVCSQVFGDLEGLRVHIDEDHLIIPEQKDHFKAWKHAVQTMLSQQSTHKFEPWIYWPSVKGECVCKCPVCGQDEYQTLSKNWVVPDHRSTMLVNTANIKTYRRAILKLYPDFATHPVWKDLA